MIDTLVQLTMFCLKNVIVRNGDTFYNQIDGIVTGDNHSVSIANITLHYITLPIADLINKTVVYKRYIDDIMWISESEEYTQELQNALWKTFHENGLHLTFRKISTEEPNKTLEFLDVNHIVDAQSPGGFYTCDFIKPTATNRLFLNGRSFHPMTVFKSIIFSESIRLRRLNEKDENYVNSVERLKQKCLKSGFNRKLVLKMTNITKMWTDRFAPPKSSLKDHQRKTIWTTSFPGLLKLSTKERSLNPEACVTYRRPQTLAQQLTRYKTISYKPNTSYDGASKPCGHCSLCGKHGNHTSMVNDARTITAEGGKVFEIWTKLNCSNWGIYAAMCKICQKLYVGQTATTFSKRWSQHRTIWKRGTSETGDSAALRQHYDYHHKAEKTRTLAEAFVVTFIDRPSSGKHLDLCESAWINRLRASININKTLLPKVM